MLLFPAVHVQLEVEMVLADRPRAFSNSMHGNASSRESLDREINVSAHGKSCHSCLSLSMGLVLSMNFTLLRNECSEFLLYLFLHLI